MGMYTYALFCSFITVCYAAGLWRGDDPIDMDTSSLENKPQHFYLISELCLMCDQYDALCDQEVALKDFVESQQKAATAIMQVS
jgi:hypothetical protein